MADEEGPSRLNPATGAVCGMLIGAAMEGVYYLLHGENPPFWLTLLGVGIIMTPIAIWARKRN